MNFKQILVSLVHKSKQLNCSQVTPDPVNYVVQTFGNIIEGTSTFQFKRNPGVLYYLLLASFQLSKSGPGIRLAESKGIMRFEYEG